MLWAGLVSLAAVGCTMAAQNMVASRACYHHGNDGGSIYDFHELDINKTENISLSAYKGKVSARLGSAPHPRWLTGQYKALNVLQNSLEDLEILGFPCNQFGLVSGGHCVCGGSGEEWRACDRDNTVSPPSQQEPGNNGQEIMNGVQYVRPGGGFQPSFTMFTKVEVNGKDAHPLFTFLKTSVHHSWLVSSDYQSVKHPTGWQRWLERQVQVYMGGSEPKGGWVREGDGGWVYFVHMLARCTVAVQVYQVEESRTALSNTVPHPSTQAFCPATRNAFEDTKRLHYSPLQMHDIRWNWEKYLITKSGKPYMRYDPTTRPEDIRDDIMFLLQQIS
ncbi:Epididymal secretory glutathione peroxidase [Chionoecetes opilio]|uniref:glutathione peroxidase n=1 Tax=Chionoecetes opilio TaxID=41210 RepID=A0A8J4YRV4_CHIOP|nr:Epididymal secretory glutathione peroxidase [Chionoecetes opilio]